MVEPLKTRVAAHGGVDVTAHELAHQWFQGLLGSNEPRWPFLDEGLAQWATGELLGRVYGRRRSAGELLGLSVDYFQAMRAVALGAGRPSLPPATPAFGFPSEWELGRAVYVQTALSVETVARVWGRERLRRALALYAERHRFGHPTPTDLLAAFDETYWPGFSRAVLEPMWMDGEVLDVRLTSAFSRRASSGAFDTEIEAVRPARPAVPLWIAIEDDEGGIDRVAWPPSQRFLHVTHHGRRPAVWVEVDPDRANVLDPDVGDNGLRVGREPPANGAFVRIVSFVGALLSWVGP
jgi:hypothetical protein